jgi:ABC-2 type transport system permease protein
MTQSFLWRPIPITMLTVRQFVGGKTVRVVAALAFIPCLFAAVYLVNSDVATPADFLGTLFLEALIAPTLLPITVLILATAALGHEVEDRTLPYLTLKPTARLRIVVEKLVGVLVVAVPAVVAGLLATSLIVAQVDSGPSLIEPQPLGPVVRAMLVAATAGTVLIASVFLAVSLFVPRALLVGIVYAFAWESLLGRFLPGIRVVSMRHYIQSIYVGVLDDPMVTIENVATLRHSFITIAAVAVVAVLLATWRLRSMNLE